MTTEIT